MGSLVEGRVAVVTGAGRGIGREHALMLASQGAKVVVNDLGGATDGSGTDASPAEEVVAEIQGMGGEAVVNGGNVADFGEAKAMIDQAVETFGTIDILINNAGILRDRSFKKMSQTEWSDVIDTNLTGVFNSCKASLEFFNQGGAIVNVASLSAVTGFFGQSNYAAAKAGVVTLTKVLSKELARQKVRVNAVAPGVVNTQMGQAIPEENRKAMLGNIPLNRFAEPSEIGDVILFLASDLSSYVTGQTIHVNGGWWG